MGVESTCFTSEGGGAGRGDRPGGKERERGGAGGAGVTTPGGKNALLHPISCKYLPSAPPGLSGSLGARPCSRSFVHLLFHPYFIIQCGPGLKRLTHWLLGSLTRTYPPLPLLPPQPLSSLAFVLCSHPAGISPKCSFCPNGASPCLPASSSPSSSLPFCTATGFVPLEFCFSRALLLVKALALPLSVHPPSISPVSSPPPDRLLCRHVFHMCFLHSPRRGPCALLNSCHSWLCMPCSWSRVCPCEGVCGRRVPFV